MSISIIIVAHQPLATALRQACLHVYPEAGAQVLAVDVDASEPVELAQKRVEDLMAQQQQDEVLVFADVFGASPCNIAQRAVTAKKAKLVAGVNLPMLLRAVNYSKEKLDDLVPKILTGGAQCIMSVKLTGPVNQHTRTMHDQQHYHHQQ